MNSENINEKHEKDMEWIRALRIIDDQFMSKVFEDKECAEVLLCAILKKKDLKVKDVHVQYDIKNLQGRSVRLDILATDESGKLYNVEVQRNNHGAVPKRARYNSSLLDANITDAGEDYKNLAETYVIFITEDDIFGANKALYHIDRIVIEIKKPFGDEAHIIYVNSKIQNNTELGKIMHDFYCTDANDIKNKKLEKRVKYFKEDEEGVTVMSNIFDEVRLETKLEAEKEKTNEIAKNLILLGIDDDKILKSTQITKSALKKLKKEIQDDGNTLQAV